MIAPRSAILRSAVFFCLYPCAALAQTYAYTPVVDEKTARPDGKGTFTFQSNSAPSFDSGKVVFTADSNNSNSRDSLWTANGDGSGLSLLLGNGQPAPGGSGAVTAIGASYRPIAKNGVVVTAVTDQDTNHGGQGVYTIPTAGGSPVLIANYTTPGGSNSGTFSNFSNAVPYGNLSTDGTRVAFYGTTSGGTLTIGMDGTVSGLPLVGIWVANIDGTALSSVASSLRLTVSMPANCSNVFSLVNSYLGGQVSGNSIVFVGAPSLSFFTSNDSLYQTDLNGIPTNLAVCGAPYSAYKILPAFVDTTASLPGDFNAAPQLSFNYLVVDGSQAAFIASDGQNASGVWLINLDGSGLTKVLFTSDSLPGFTPPLKFAGVSLSNGQVAFGVADSSSQPLSGIFTSQNGQIAKVVSTGDTLNGGTVQYGYNSLNVGPTSLSNGTVAFVAKVNGLAGVYVASPQGQ